MSVKVTKAESTSDMSVGKIQKTLDELVKIFRKNKLTTKEILMVYGNLGYTLGASIGGYQDKGPAPEQLTHMYATAPTIDVALMLNGINTTLWVDDIGKTVEQLKSELTQKETEST